MKKKLLTVVSLLLSAIFLFACGGKDGGGGSKGDPQVLLWSAYATDKIMRDVSYENKGEAKLSYEMCKNEIEGAQLIITPENNYKVGSFTVDVSELSNGQGGTIPASALNVYLQKYMNIERKLSNNPYYSAGYMPDALLPFDVAAEYKENTVSGVNQGIYVTVETEKDTPAGNYTGVCTVTVDGKKYSVPVEVTVWDFAISDEVHAKSVFEIWRNQLIYGELDSSDEMVKLYIEALRQQRLSSTHLIGNTIEEFIESAKEATSDPRVSAYALPNAVAGATDIDEPKAKEWLKAIVKASTPECCLIDKLVYQFGTLVDEPQFDTTGIRNKRVPRVIASMDRAEAAVLAELEAEGYFDGFSAEYKAHVYETLPNIANLVTAPYNEDYGDGVTYCPMFDEFDSAGQREVYLEEKEKAGGNLWWYGCTGPMWPYPTYHNDDILTGARILSWMQYDYGIDGNLYYCVNVYTAINYSTNGDYSRPVNCWEYSRRNTHRDAINGDGYLFYPGAYYGIKGPVGTLRLHTIRDGLEEYEYLYELNKLIEDLGVYYGEELSVNDTLRNLFDRLYTGTKPVADSANFYSVRREVADIIARSNSEEKLVISSMSYLGDSARLEFNVAGGFSVKVNGETLSGNTQGGGSKYVATKKLDEKANYFDIEVSKDGYTKTHRIFIGGKTTLALGFDDENDISFITPNNADAIEISYTTDSEYTVSGGAVKAVINSTFDPLDPISSLTYRPQLSLKLSDLNCNITNTDTIGFTLYNDSGRTISVKLCLYTSLGTRYELSTQSIRAGNNVVTVNMVDSSVWSQLSLSTRFVLEFSNTLDDGGTEAMPTQTVYIDNVIISEKV